MFMSLKAKAWHTVLLRQHKEGGQIIIGTVYRTVTLYRKKESDVR